MLLLFLVAYRGPAKWRLARLGQENHFHKKGECPTGYEKLSARSTPAVDCRRRCWCRHRLRPDIILTQCHCYPTKARRRNDDNTGEQHTHKALLTGPIAIVCVALFCLVGKTEPLSRSSWELDLQYIHLLSREWDSQLMKMFSPVFSRTPPRHWRSRRNCPQRCAMAESARTMGTRPLSAVFSARAPKSLCARRQGKERTSGKLRIG